MYICIERERCIHIIWYCLLGPPRTRRRAGERPRHPPYYNQNTILTTKVDMVTNIIEEYR